MNASVAGSRRPPEPQDVAAFTAVSVARRPDALPVISAIVVGFVLLAVLIILAVRYGPQLRTLQLTLQHEPMPQDMDGGVHLTDWRRLECQKKLPAHGVPGLDWAAGSCQCPCKHHLPCGSAEPNVIEVTYL